MPVMKERIPHTQSGNPADDCHNVAMMPSLIRPPHPTDPRRSCTLPWFWMVHHPSHGCTSHAHTLASFSPPLPGDYNVYMWLVEYTRSLHTYYYHTQRGESTIFLDIHIFVIHIYTCTALPSSPGCVSVLGLVHRETNINMAFPRLSPWDIGNSLLQFT